MPLHGGDIYGFMSPDGVRLDFSVNTNPLGIPDAVFEALKHEAPQFARYPDPYCREVKKALAVYEGIDEKQILCGAGASDLIYRLCLAARPRRLLLFAPTFSEYQRAAHIAGAEVLVQNLQEHNSFRLTDTVLEILAQEKDRTDMLFLCNPNNPTGALIDPELLEAIASQCERSAIALVVDECFLPFTEAPSLVSPNMPHNLAVLKAFTKTYSLAGLRFGYVITPNRELLAKAAQAGPCWNVSAPAQIAALAALGCDDHLRKAKALIAQEQVFLSQGLRDRGFRVFESNANFLLFKSEGPLPLYEELLKKGILIRSCSNFSTLDRRYYRVAIKTREENETLLAAIGEVRFNFFN